MEDGPVDRNFWGPDVTARRLVGVLAYDNGDTTARLTAVRFDDAGGWAGRLSVQSVIAESFRVLAVASLGDGQTLDAMLSASAQLGAFEVAGTVNKVDEDVVWSGSVTQELSPYLALRAGAMIAEDDAGYDGFRNAALGVFISPWENAALELTLGLVEDSWYPEPLWYGKASLDWHISESAKAKMSAAANTDGDYNIESELVTVFW